MAVTTSPSALLPLDAPLPQPRAYNLLDTAQTITPEGERWQAGAWLRGYPAGDPGTFDNCAEGTFRQKNLDASNDSPMAGAFTVYLGGSCTARSVGPRLDDYRGRLRLAFQAVESEAVERVLATGDGWGTIGAYIGDPNMEDLGGPFAPTKALRILEDEIASVGSGMIHAGPATAAEWSENGLVARARDNLLRTVGNYTPVVVGAGYRDSRPDGLAIPSSTQEYAYATGQVGYIRGEIFDNGDYSQVLDREQNEVTLIAERNYVLVWVGRQDTADEHHIQAGVLVNLDG